MFILDAINLDQSSLSTNTKYYKYLKKINYNKKYKMM